MLRWLPSALYSRPTERQHFLQNILLFVLGAHILLLLVMVGASMFDRKHDSYSISMHQSGATYVLMPLQKKVDQPKKSKKISHGVHKKSHVVNYEDYERQKNIKKRGPSKAVKQIKAVPASKLKSSLQKIMQQDRASAALVQERKVAPIKKTRVTKKKNKVKIVEAVAVPAEVQPAEEFMVKPEAVAQSTVQDHVDRASQDVISTMPEQSLEPSGTSEITESFDSDNVVFVGYEQLDECIVGSKIQQAIQQSWTPPIGVAIGTSCQMRVTVSAQGAAADVKIEKGSGVFVYDASAKTALRNVEYPKEVWNKTITIVLAN